MTILPCARCGDACRLLRGARGASAPPSSARGRGAALASHPIRRQYRSMDKTPEENGSGVGVLDKAAIVLGALEAGPATLAQLVQSTGLARPTAHRLAVALEYHHLVARDMQGRFILGPRLGDLAAAAGEDPLAASPGPVPAPPRAHTGDSRRPLLHP